MESKFHLPSPERPEWLCYPDFFNELVANGEDDFDLWYLLEANRVKERRFGMSQRYPLRDLVPFATRDDNDDVACWDSQYPQKVFIVHDFASAGYEHKEVFCSFEEWHKKAIVEAEEF